MTRGLRNNNPLNIEKTRGGNPWQGEVVPSKDKRFAQFTTVAYGYRAAFKLLNNYQRNYGLDTIRKMIGRWAPSEENHTDAYVRTVAERSGVPADSRITTTNRDVMVPIVAAMSFVENGVEAKMLDEKLGYVGFSNIDMKYDSRTGRYVLFEINPRLGRSSYFCRAAGLNMMKLLTNDVVYGKREDCVYNHTVALWQNVPTGILRRYVKDQELSDELKQFKGTHTLFCKGDLPLSRLYRLLRYYAAQYHNFRDYYFDKK